MSFCFIFLEECGSSVSLSEKTRLNRKSVQFLVKEELFEDFKQSNLNEQLALALADGLGIPEESITCCRARHPPPFSMGKRILVALKALITILVSRVEEEQIRKQVNGVINIISGATQIQESEVEIVQILPSNSCLLVIRLPGLAVVKLIIAVLQFIQQMFSQRDGEGSLQNLCSLEEICFSSFTIFVLGQQDKCDKR